MNYAVISQIARLRTCADRNDRYDGQPVIIQDRTIYEYVNRNRTVIFSAIEHHIALHMSARIEMN